MQPKPKTIRGSVDDSVIEALLNGPLRAMVAMEYPINATRNQPIIHIDNGNISEILFSDLKRQIRVMNLEYLIKKVSTSLLVFFNGGGNAEKLFPRWPIRRNR